MRRPCSSLVWPPRSSTQFLPCWHLSCVQPSFLPHYVQIASRKLLLFHGRRNLAVKGKQQQQQSSATTNSSNSNTNSSSSSDLILRLSDIVNSPVMAELQELLMLGPGAEQERDLYSNWFSLQSTQRVLATFTAWDLDGNGTLSKTEFSAISQVSLRGKVLGVLCGR